MDLERLLSAVERAEQSALGREDDTLSRERAQALDYYLGRPFGDEMPGRSKVVSRDVADTIEWIKPSLCRIFTGAPELVRFEPRGPEDEEAARQESDYVNYVLTQKNNWFEIFYTWCTDALLTRNAYVLAHWSEEDDTTKERYQGLTEMQLAMISQDPTLEIVAAQQIPMAQGMAWDVVVQRRKGYGCVRVRNLPPERCLVSNTARSASLLDADFFEYWEDRTLSSLRDDGFEVDDDIADDAGGGRNDTELDLARDIGVTHQWGDDDSSDPAMRKVRVRQIWIKHDYDEDGFAELRQLTVVGRTLLRKKDGGEANDEVSTIPVACAVPTPMPHRHVGQSIYDMVQDIQRIKSTILRQVLDNMYLVNNNRTAISNKVNLDDLLTTRPGGVVRVATDVADVSGHAVPIVQQFMGAQALQVVEYVDQIRQNRTGTSQYFTGVDANALNKTATGIQQLTASAAQRVELIARVFAESVKDLFIIVHELTLKHATGAEKVRLNGNWVDVDPTQWRTRTDMQIAVGVAVGSRQERMQMLMTTMQIQEKMMAGGLQVVTPENVFNAASEWAKEAGFSSPEKFYTNPKNIPPSPPQPDPEMAKLEQQGQVEAAKLRLQKEKQDQEAAARERELAIREGEVVANVQLKAHTEQSRIAMQRDNHAATIEASAKPPVQIGGSDEFKAILAQMGQFMAEIAQRQEQSTQMMGSVLQQLAMATSAPKEIVRGPDGKAMGVRSVPQGMQ